MKKQNEIKIFDVVDEELYEKLQSLRKEIAMRKSVPSFVIFQNSSLEEMVHRKPTTLEELTTLKGIGIGKATKYGKPFLKIIIAHLIEYKQNPQ